jgi:hypothetical protein
MKYIELDFEYRLALQYWGLLHLYSISSCIHGDAFDLFNAGNEI